MPDGIALTFLDRTNELVRKSREHANRLHLDRAVRIMENFSGRGVQRFKDLGGSDDALQKDHDVDLF